MQRLKDLALSPSGFVFDPFTGATFTANSTALFLLEQLREGRSRADLVAGLRERFDTRDEDLPRDVDDLVATLRLHGLVPADFEVA